ncbi:MAG: hypothetical protein MUC99_06795 [Anaerolineae bacterium]|nr:hypothetical protein [Anaerolineae bacterium]
MIPAVVCPQPFTGQPVEGVDFPVQRADVDRLGIDDRRRVDLPAGEGV